jgi:hypothetical protein
MTHRRLPEKTLEGLRPYTCPECRTDFRSPEELGRHLHEHDRTCQECGRVSKTHPGHLSHLRGHWARGSRMRAG